MLQFSEPLSLIHTKAANRRADVFLAHLNGDAQMLGMAVTPAKQG